MVSLQRKKFKSSFILFTLMSNWLLLIISIDLIGFGNSKITQNALYTLMTKMVTISLDEAKEFTRLTCHRSTGVKMLDGILCPCQIHHSHIELQKREKIGCRRLVTLRSVTTVCFPEIGKIILNLKPRDKLLK